VVAVGALLAAGTALYFNMASGSQVGSPSSIEKMEVAPKFTDLDAVDNYLSVEDLRKYVYPEEPIGVSPDTVRNSTVDRTLSNMELERMDYEADRLLWAAAHNSSESSPFSNREIEHLERQIASLLADAARDPSRNTPQLNREIEHLDNEIDMLRLNAMQNQSADRPLSSEASGTWPPDTKYYLDPDYRVEAQRN
jgi:hypothetical protein